jgi:hypothetical protein
MNLSPNSWFPSLRFTYSPKESVLSNVYFAHVPSSWGHCNTASIDLYKRTNKCGTFTSLSCFNRTSEYYDLNASKHIEKLISYKLSVNVVQIYSNFFRIFRICRIILARVIDLSMVFIPNNPGQKQDNGPLSLSLHLGLNQNPLNFNVQLLIYLPTR